MKKTLIIFFFGFSCFTFAQSSSFYDLKTKWSNQNGQQVQLKDFSGQPILLSMVYTSCAHSCPMTISKFQQIKKELDDAGFKNIKFVLASFDDENDKPENLKSYMKKRNLDEKLWTFLSPASESAARELSVVLGLSFKKMGGGNFSHSNVITLLGPKGEFLSKIDNLTSETQVFADALKKIQK